MYIKEELFEQYLLSDSKVEFIKSLIPESHEHLYFQVLHSLNTKPVLSEEDINVLTKLKNTYSRNQNEGYKLHQFEFQHLIRTLDSSKSNGVQREQALKDLKNYFNIKFSTVKSNILSQVGVEGSSQVEDTPQLQSCLDQNIINFQNYLNKSYTNHHYLSKIVPQALYRLDVNKLLTDSKNTQHHSQILETFVSNVPCLHQVKDVPKIYKAIYDEYQSRKHIYVFTQAWYDRLSSSQLKELGNLMNDVVFETKEYQFALIKKLFFRDISQFLDKDNTNLTQLEKYEKKKQYSNICNWAKDNLPKKLSYLQRLINQEIVILNAELGDYNKDFFIEFIKNPPTAIREQYNKNIIQQENIWNQVFEFTKVDQSKQLKLVEKYLNVFFRTQENIKPYERVLDEKFLNRTFYKSKILSGQQEYITKSTSIFTNTEIDTLVNSRQITILENNNRYIQGNHEVKLQVETKNIQNMTLNIFEIKTENYYLQKKSQFDNSINLDGLVPIHTSEFSYKDPSNQVVLREFSLESIQKAVRGLFIVEFFGNSISSRAVFKKGLLAIVETPTIAGHLITLVNECSEICKPTEGGKTGIWLNQRFHSSNPDGHIMIPYSNSTENPQAILVHNEFSELESFQVLTEEYLFQCTYLYNQESFLLGSKSKIIIRPTLSINKVLANMALIEEQLIKLHIRNHQDISSTIEFKDIKFDEKKDIEIEVPIQGIIKYIEIFCHGVINKMNGTKQNLVNSKKLTFELHQVPSNQIFNLYLKKTESLGYVVQALDKSGQPLEKVHIEFQLFHQKINENFNALLQTDIEGKVVLGKLDNITRITACVRELKNLHDVNAQWTIMSQFRVELPNKINIIENETIQLPLPKEVGLSRENLTLYSVNYLNHQELVYEDLFDILRLEGDMLTISNLKQGMYVLHILELQTYISIHVHQGQYWKQNNQFLISNGTFISVERFNEKLVSIKETSFIPQNEKQVDVLIKLNLPKSLTDSQRKKLRVHAFAYNFLSNEKDTFVQNIRNNRVTRNLTRIDIRSTPANFFNNKKISDEICYVYNRKCEQKRIGNTLEKPCVLLKRTFNRDTTFDEEKLDKGQNYSDVLNSSKQKKKMFDSADYCKNSSLRSTVTNHVKGEIDTFLNFLNFPCFVSSNHEVSEDGQVTISGLVQNHYACIQIVVTSPNLAISDIFPITTQKTLTQDLRHHSSMKSDQFYTENLSSGKLLSTQSLQISADSQTSVIGSITELFEIQKQLMKTGRGTDEYQGRDYSTWQFLKEWNNLTDKQKLEKYNEYACHEINLFLYFKDANFFKIVVEPFLQNKMKKTFIDFFLLNNKEEILKYSHTERINELNILEQSLLILILVKNNLKQRAEYLASSIENIQKTQVKNIDLQKRLQLTIIESSAKDQIKKATQELKNGVSSPLQSSDPKECLYKMSNRNAVLSSLCVKQNIYKDHDDDDSDDYDCEGEEEVVEEPSPLSLLQQRKEFKEGYKNLEKTTEYIERQYYCDNKINNYSHLVQVNQFWSDVVRHIVDNNGIENFVSQNFIFAFNNHVEAISVLALMDISFSVRENYDLNSFPGRKIQILARKNIVYYSKEIVQSSEINKANVNIIQSFFDPNDRFTTLKDDSTVKIEKEVEEFVINKIYGCKVIVTNISIANLNLSVLYEIPEGSIPVNSFEYTKSIDLFVNSYQTLNNIEFFFYFPKPGTFQMYRSNASRNGIIVTQANEIPQIVVKSKAEIKKMENLSDILNNGSQEDILKFAKVSNLHDKEVFNITKILSIVQSDKQFFLNFLEILRQKGIFNRTIWEYSFYHNYEQGILECLNNEEFKSTRMSQDYLKVQSHQSDQLSYDYFSVYEYHPLLTSRVHSFMDQNKSKILNIQFKKTYYDYINYLAHVPEPQGNHYLVLCYYLILQERIDDALKIFSKIKQSDLSKNSKIQYDYFAAYLDIYIGGPNFKKAREIIEAYLEYPIISWRNLFVNLCNQLAEYDGEVLDESEIAENTDLSKNLKNADKESTVSFEVSGKQLKVYYQNIDMADINLYQLDIEVLFSTQPFMSGGDKNEFTFIKPNQTIKLVFQKQSTLEKKTIDIPQAYSNKNLYIQLVSSVGVQNHSYFSSDLKIQMIEKYGQVKVLDQSNNPLQKVYIKCYAKQKDNKVVFFRDGYTDLRGRFDYALSSSNDLNSVKEFSILICSEENGSVIKQVSPPITSGRMETTVSLLSKKK